MGTNEPAGLADLAGLSALDEPVRRRLYGYVIAQDDPVSREQAAAAVGIGRTLAAYHLDKLAEAGLLSIAYQRPPGRGGPGGGRPAKLYRRTEREFAVSVPPRAYDLLARLLVESVEKDPTGTVHAALTEVARDTGRQTAAAAGGDLMAALHECGYQPRDGEDGVIELRNCPFHRLAQDHRDLVCGLNLSLVTGIVRGSSAERARAALQPLPNRCCVVVHQGEERRGADRGGGMSRSPTVADSTSQECRRDEPTTRLEGAMMTRHDPDGSDALAASPQPGARTSEAGSPGEEGGEPACWAHLLCPECGAMTSETHRPGCGLAAGDRKVEGPVA